MRLLLLFMKQLNQFTSSLFSLFVHLFISYVCVFNKGKILAIFSLILSSLIRVSDWIGSWFTIINFHVCLITCIGLCSYFLLVLLLVSKAVKKTSWKTFQILHKFVKIQGREKQNFVYFTISWDFYLNNFLVLFGFYCCFPNPGRERKKGTKWWIYQSNLKEQRSLYVCINYTFFLSYQFCDLPTS